MNKYTSEFLETVCSQIKYKKIHQDISRELREHIDEITGEYIDSGMTEDDAIKKAVQRMGNPIEIGREFHKTHRPKPEWSIIMLIGMMVLVGAGVLFSIASDSAFSTPIEQFFKSYLIYTLIGIGVCIMCYFFDYTKIEKYSLHIFVITLAFLFVSRQWSPSYVNGLPQFVIGPFRFTSISIVLPFFLISFSGLLNKWVTGDIKDMLKLLALAAAAVFMCLTRPSFANAMLLGCGFLVMLTISIMSKDFKGKRNNFLLWIYGGVIGGIFLNLFLMIMTGGYHLCRIKAFFNPESDPTSSGYVYITVQKILSGAKLFGRGDGLYFNYKGIDDAFVLPMANSEFIFTYIVSVFGWIAGIIVVFIATLTIIRMFLATGRIHSSYGKYAASSIVTVFALQIIANILMNIGLFPILGITLPLISYGGTNFVTNMALIGLLLGIYRRKDLVLINSNIRE
ncbi:FtsW/RodA/SpoVE family cell cycle protein [Brassicibacter mesophilus]|uniref:FtsW/RodA/SpoVE family cell cycle protein n=1 Tax=Brassicibacter mesophilus TaxID=745119 RepID=UPI003D2518A2